MDEPVDDLHIVATISSNETLDPDDVPSHDEGVCRYWGAWEDSPVPNTRVFAVFNREPKDEAEAEACVREHYGTDEEDSDDN